MVSECNDMVGIVTKTSSFRSCPRDLNAVPEICVAVGQKFLEQRIERNAEPSFTMDTVWRQ